MTDSERTWGLPEQTPPPFLGPRSEELLSRQVQFIKRLHDELGPGMGYVFIPFEPWVLDAIGPEHQDAFFQSLGKRLAQEIQLQMKVWRDARNEGEPPG